MVRKPKKIKSPIRRLPYIFLLLASFLIVFFFGGKTPYALFFLCLLFPFFSLFQLFLTRRRVTVSHELEQSFVPKGVETKYTVFLENASALPTAPFLTLTGKPPRLSDHADSVRVSDRLAPGAIHKLSTPTGFPYRGAYEIGAPIVRLVDMLGLWTLRLKPPPPVTLVVSPRVLPLERCPYLSSVHHEYRQGNRTGSDDVSTVTDTRLYQYGDPMNRIHWKLTAQKGDLISRLYENDHSPELLVILDNSKGFPEEGDPLELADRLVECVLAVLAYCLAHDIHVRLVHRRNGLPQWQGQSDKASFDHIVRHLSALPFAETDSFESFLSGGIALPHRFADIFAFTPSLSLGICAALRALHPAGRPPCVIHTPAQRAVSASDDIPVSVLAFEVNQGDDIPAVLTRGFSR